MKSAGAAYAAIDPATLVVAADRHERSLDGARHSRHGDESIVDAYRTVVEACNAHGKVAGIAGVYEESLMRLYIGMSVRLVFGATISAL